MTFFRKFEEIAHATTDLYCNDTLDRGQTGQNLISGGLNCSYFPCARKELLISTHLRGVDVGGELVDLLPCLDAVEKDGGGAGAAGRARARELHASGRRHAGVVVGDLNICNIPREEKRFSTGKEITLRLASAAHSAHYSISGVKPFAVTL